ncbi:MAG: 4'-phosphopantetheinyl transferase superfamily protein [Oscillospiraceae bacterium]|nr:4'-phosphopantetheinyl transferase superfamily protein [Oscillospiraceae bacterium]
MNQDCEHPVHDTIRKIPIPERFGMLTVCEAGSSRQEQHQAAHVLLRESAGKLLTDPAEIEEKLCLAYHPGGKPFFKNYPALYFNLSHCDGLAVCLVSSRECGADVEMRRAVRPGILRKIFTSEEQELVLRSDNPDLEFTRIWTLKEAYVKAIGKGIAFPMQKIFFTCLHPEIRSNQQHAEFHQIMISESGYVISLCILEK